jgi:hypothetical protein
MATSTAAPSPTPRPDGTGLSWPRPSRLPAQAITRETIIRGLAGTIAFTPAAITVILETPGQPRIARALAMVIDEINHTPPAIPGDNRPITYRIAPQTRI